MDDDGNRSSVKVTPYGQSAATTSYTDNNLNQYTAVGGTSRTHDKNGNLTDDGTLDYEYDYKNQIVRIKNGSNTVGEYKYDALGRRVEKDDGKDIERFIYSGDETISVYDGSDVWIRDFVFGQGIDEILAMNQADVLDHDSDSNTTEATMSFYHRNALGSVMAITDANEAEVVSYRYDPYGAVTITRNSTTQSSDPLGNPWMYTGRFTDEESGLYYYRARYYSPATGRFLQRDPLGYAPGAGLYQYVSSSPSNRVDPYGLDEVSEAEKAVEEAEAAEKAAEESLADATAVWNKAGTALDKAVWKHKRARQRHDELKDRDARRRQLERANARDPDNRAVSKPPTSEELRLADEAERAAKEELDARQREADDADAARQIARNILSHASGATERAKRKLRAARSRASAAAARASSSDVDPEEGPPFYGWPPTLEPGTPPRPSKPWLSLCVSPQVVDS